MSTRALRKLQREQELEKQLAAAREAEDVADESEDEDDGGTATVTKKQFNAFDMLEDAEEDDEPEEADETPSQPRPLSSSIPTVPKPATSKSKKKKKPKKKPSGTSQDTAPREESGDEIDRALKELGTKSAASQSHDESVAATKAEARAYQLLSVDTKYLNPLNEMKGLFGNVALEGEARGTTRTPRRREQNQQGGVDLATALTGRYCVGSRGKELGSLATRRNILMQGKEEWPLATSGGLSMDLDAAATPEKSYNIVHNTAYRETQMQFRAAVESMDPQRMIGLLNIAPYHIATLLQVSEIARSQNDHSVSGDLIERALYSFGRSVQSTFPSALRNGTARLPFDKPANREFYLTIWRYMRNLEMRGTWRTAFEWAKILYQLNPISDPYGVTLMIDQLALRGRQHLQLIELASAGGFENAWAHLPNIQISLALAYSRVSQPKEARKQLAIAMTDYPYILGALASALDISPLPKAIWGKLPSTDAETLFTELYVTRTKDLWGTPDASALLVEVAQTLDHYSAFTSSRPPPPKLEVSLEDTRHLFLLDIPALIAHLPRNFRNMPTSTYDPLPPPDSTSDFTMRAPGTANAQSPLHALFSTWNTTTDGAPGVLQRILNWFQTPTNPNQQYQNNDADAQAAYNQLREELGQDIPPEIIEQLLALELADADQQAPITAAGLGMAPAPGGWDYYEEAANNSSYDEDDGHGSHSSMPDLEAVPTETSEPAPSTPRNPHAAMVEEVDSDEDRDSGNRGAPATTGRAVLRRADSDDEDDDTPVVDSNSGEARVDPMAHPPPTHTLYAQTSSPPAHSADLSIESDPQRLQRWLISAGLEELRVDTSKLGMYVRRLKMLPKRQMDWVVSMVRQRAGVELESRVKAAL